MNVIVLVGGLIIKKKKLMAKIFKERRMWTKNDIKLIHKLWTNKTTEEVCKEMNLTKIQVQYMVRQMRKAGIDMPKKHRSGHVMNLLYELAHELKNE